MFSVKKLMIIGCLVFCLINSSPNRFIEASASLFVNGKAYTEGRGVWIEWRTAREDGVIGFRIYRFQGRVKELVTPGFISSTNLFVGENPELGRVYNYFDPRGNAKTFYSIETTFQDGSVQESGRFKPERVKSLEKIAGSSGQELLQRTSAEPNPFVYRENLEIPPDISVKDDLLTESSNFETQGWVASQPGVKIGVKQDGIYRVSRSALQNAGFDINAPVERWQLYADGVEQPIRIIGNGDFIEFYGRGIDLNETDTRVYYLIVGENNGRRIRTKVLRPSNAKVQAKSFQQSIIKRDNLFYINSILNGPRLNFFGALVSTSGGTTTINLPAIDLDSPTIDLEISVQGLSYTAHEIRVLLNNVQIGNISGLYRSLMVGNFTVPTSMFVEGNNTIKLVETISNSISFIEQVKVTYKRGYQANQEKLLFYTSNYRLTKVRGFSSPNILLYDIAQLDDPKLIVNPTIESDGSNFNLVLPSSRGSVFYATTESAILSPAFVKANIPSTLSTPNNVGRMVIVAYSNWLGEAENWANYRRSQGFTVKVVDVEDIFDEFDFGLPTGESIRRFLQYAKTNWLVPPDYVLLIGDATFDPRNFRGDGFNNLVPTIYVDTAYMETGSDEALADFDGDGLAEIPIGRIATRNVSVVNSTLVKTIAFEQGLSQAFSRGALFPSDLPDGYDFEQMNNRLINELPSTIPVTTVNRSASDARERVLSGFNSGVYLVNYSGHGTFTAWAGNLFSRNDVSSLTNTNDRLIIVNTLTCLNGYFIESSQESLAEALVNKLEGGAVASWASSALTTPDVQEIMAKRFYQNLRIGSYERIGDMIRDAKTVISSGRDVRLSWTLLGDPALRIKTAIASTGEEKFKASEN